MQGYAKIIAAASLCTGLLGAVAGYSFHAPTSLPAITCNTATDADHATTAHKSAPLGASPWMREPAHMDSSWVRWPTLTDF